MANTSVAITPGAGANVDAFSQSSGDLRQAVVVGDPASTESAEVITAAMAVRPGRAASRTVTSVTAAAIDTPLLAANTARVGFMVFNDSTADLNLKYGTGASATSYSVKVPPNGVWVDKAAPMDTGAINGIWTAANGAARCTEWT